MLALLLDGVLCWTPSSGTRSQLILSRGPRDLHQSSTRRLAPICLLPPLPRGSSSTDQAAAVPVDIVVTGMNSRCISASCVVAASPDQASISAMPPIVREQSHAFWPLFVTPQCRSQVWKILTDYDNLSRHVPNLVKSEVRPLRCSRLTHWPGVSTSVSQSTHSISLAAPFVASSLCAHLVARGRCLAATASPDRWDTPLPGRRAEDHWV